MAKNIAYEVLSVFVDSSHDASRSGNALAVIPDPPPLTDVQMQAIAAALEPPPELGVARFSETVFVMDTSGSAYEVRIFTPHEELAFAGHPTLGTAWLLRDLGRVEGERLEQHSAAGVTPVASGGDVVWFERSGSVASDVEDRDPLAARRLAKSLRVDSHDIGLEPRELGRSGRLRPAFSDAGLEQLIVPLRDAATLEAAHPVDDSTFGDVGAYCFTAVQAGRLRARGFFGPVGITEDPGTGSAAAALGVYLADRVGAIDFEVMQGVEMGRPCRILVRADVGRVQVGGVSVRVTSGKIPVP